MQKCQLPPPRPPGAHGVPSVSRRVFDKYDKDRSGSISKAEFGAMVEELGYKLSPKELDFALKKLDEDGSGDISYEEFRSWWVSDQRFVKLQLSDEHLAKLTQWQKFFTFYDKDKSGTIQLAEFSQMHANLIKNKVPVPKNSKDCFGRIDTDNSGFISFNEFTTYLIELGGLK